MLKPSVFVRRFVGFAASLAFASAAIAQLCPSSISAGCWRINPWIQIHETSHDFCYCEICPTFQVPSSPIGDPDPQAYNITGSTNGAGTCELRSKAKVNGNCPWDVCWGTVEGTWQSTGVVETAGGGACE